MTRGFVRRRGVWATDQGGVTVACSMPGVTHLNQPIENHVMLVSDAPGFGDLYIMSPDGTGFRGKFYVPEGAWLVITDVFFLAHAMPAPGVVLPFSLDLGPRGGPERGGEVSVPLRATCEGTQSQHMPIQGGIVVGSGMRVIPKTGQMGTIRLLGYLLGVQPGWMEQFRERNEEPPPLPPEPSNEPMRPPMMKRRPGG